MSDETPFENCYELPDCYELPACSKVQIAVQKDGYLLIDEYGEAPGSVQLAPHQSLELFRILSNHWGSRHE
jgi:hypothetical protein